MECENSTRRIPLLIVLFLRYILTSEPQRFAEIWYCSHIRGYAKYIDGVRKLFSLCSVISELAKCICSMTIKHTAVHTEYAREEVTISIYQITTQDPQPTDMKTSFATHQTENA